VSPTDRDDVSQSITITLTVAGKAEADIPDVRAPLQAGAGESITIEVDLKNIGTGAGKLYGYIKDTDTNQIVGAKAYTSSLPVNGTQTLTWTLTMPNKDWHLKIWGGHVE